MKLSPVWIEFFGHNSWQAVHWSTVGDPQATDRVIAEWARVHDYVVFTHELDFGTIRAVTRAEGPSVFQVRTQGYSLNILEV